MESDNLDPRGDGGQQSGNPGAKAPLETCPCDTESHSVFFEHRAHGTSHLLRAVEDSILKSSATVIIDI